MRSLLRSILVRESRAYGFTIGFWGSGILLVENVGMPSLLDVLFYGGGAVTGFALLSLIAFRTPLKEADHDSNDLLVLSMIHYLASLGPIIATYAITINFSGQAAFFLAGASVSILYNVLMLVEEWVSEEALYIEKKLSL